MARDESVRDAAAASRNLRCGINVTGAIVNPKAEF
jgi:hypothetical protein